jgi:predicted nuclease of predicted toxin-antitoxin system
MKILFDERVPWPLRKLLGGHECTTAKLRGWGGYKNGDLIRLAEADFDLLITADQNLRYQQNLTGRNLAILELSTNDLRRIQAAGESFVAAIHSMEPKEYRQWQVP